MSETSGEHRETASLRGVRLLRPYGRGLALVVGLLCLLALTDMVQPYFLKLLIDDVFVSAGGGGNWGLLWVILPGMGLIYVTRNFLFYASRMRALRISEDLCFELRKRLFEHLQQLSMRFYRSHQPGKVSARLMDDTFKIQAFIQDKLPTLIRYFIEFQILLIVIYLVNWRLAIASTIVLPLHLWTYRHFRAPIRKSHSEAQEHLAAAHGNIVEKFLGMEVVKGFSAEQQEERSFRKAIDASRKSTIRSQRFHFTQKVVADLVVGLGMVVLLGYGAWEVRMGRMSGGAFFMFFWYMKMLYPAVLEVISGAGHLSRAMGSVDRVFEMLDEPAHEIGVHDDGAIEPTDLAGRIELADVSFAYEEQGPLVLADVSLSIQPGEHVAVTGPSGSGKSTLISLLPRFNDPTSGNIRIDGLPAEEIAFPALRGMFGLVFQEVFLFNASVYENLRYARPDATLEEVEAACRVTGAHEVIENLPDGYLTKIGAGGELSRGEKQRITLARALVRNPRVLILDEATASIDAAAAREIIRSILTLMEGRTVIMVTHDSELLDLVDRVISIDDGRVVHDGAPAPSGPPAPPRASHERRHRGGRSTHGGLASLILLAALLTAACVREQSTNRSVAMERPRSSHGIMLESEGPVDLSRLANALDALPFDPADLPAPMDDASAAALATPLVLTPEPATLDRRFAELPLRSDLPADSVRLVALPKLSAVEILELIERLALRLTAVDGYAEAGSILLDVLPALPEGIVETQILGRPEEAGTRVIRFGYRCFASQPSQLYVLGVTLRADGSMEANGDLALVEPAIAEIVSSVDELRKALTVQELEAKLIQLSYVDAGTAITMLKGMGISCVAEAGALGEVKFEALPYVIKIPDPTKEDTGLIGSAELKTGLFGISLTPNIAGALPYNNIASPMTQLLVMFHPAHPEQFSRVRTMLDEYIDRPARQIFVEGLVLEIAEDGLEDLGIEWEIDQSPIRFRFGSLNADGVDDTLDFQADDIDWHRVFTRDFLWQWSVKIRALIRDGKAEVLSRPSVLTINNRQSTIRVGRDIPIATSQEGTAVGSNKIAFNFQYLPTGILLNIRPRINEDGSEVSMLIDTIVSATVPGEDLQIRSVDGELLASAPTVSTRRVQTYARIRNNTPFIIGGLVARTDTLLEDKVPFLGDLPLIGAAFRSQRSDHSKREVIIVLTPYVLPEDTVVSRSLPKDVDLFDSFGDKLFRDSYRIRGGDVFDLSFLFKNPRLTAYRDLAREAIQSNFRLSEQEPFRSFAQALVPGEDILVTRMIYEVIKRLDVAKAMEIPRIIYFERQKGVGGYDVRFLERMLAEVAGGFRYQAFFEKHPEKAIAMTYYYDGLVNGANLTAEPVPELAIIDLKDSPNRDEWKRVLWDMNQPDDRGRRRATILIQNEDDLERVQRALMLKRVVALNGGRENLTTSNFNVGHTLLLPVSGPDERYVIDADIAQFFFHTEHYYAATLQVIEDRVAELDAVLRTPEIKSLIRSRTQIDLDQTAPLNEPE